MTEPDGPYVGPRPFAREDRERFFGRSREEVELGSLVIAHPAVLLYSQSGAGKTSLLQARLLPLLEERGTQILGPVRVGGDLTGGVSLEEVSNVFVFNTLASLIQKDEALPARRLTLEKFLQDRPRVLPDGQPAARRVLVFDQFEEIFTSFPERWADRHGFFDQVGEALAADPRLRVLFAMREEYAAGLDPFVDLLPERLRTRFRLERLREAQAREAVREPLKGTERSFAPGVAEKLVANLLQVPVRGVDGKTVQVPGEFVEPVQLQVVCQRLWKSLPPEETLIREKYLEDYADVDEALAAYYQDCVQEVAGQKSVREGRLRRWFGHTLITPEGTRGIVHRNADTVGELPFPVVKALEDRHLVRMETRAGAPWYELTHDRFIEPIRQSNRRWIGERDSKKRWYEDRAERWQRSQKPEDFLTEEEAAEAARWLASPDAEDLGTSASLQKLIEGSLGHYQARKLERRALTNRRLRWQMAGMGFLLLLVMFLAWKYYQAKENEENAKLIERGEVAKYLAGQGKVFDALVYGIKAVDNRAHQGKEVPSKALDGLRIAISVAGRGHWLVTSGQIYEFGLSPDGMRAFTIESMRLLLWDADSGHIVAELPGEFLNAAFSRDSTYLVLIGRFSRDLRLSLNGEVAPANAAVSGPFLFRKDLRVLSWEPYVNVFHEVDSSSDEDLQYFQKLDRRIFRRAEDTAVILGDDQASLATSQLTASEMLRTACRQLQSREQFKAVQGYCSHWSVLPPLKASSPAPLRNRAVPKFSSGRPSSPAPSDTD